MRTGFNASRESASEKTLRRFKIKYTRQEDGTLLVRQNIKLPSIKMRHLPDFSDVVVDGDFACDHNELESLIGAPRVVTGVFRCEHNRLRSLDGLPQVIGGDVVLFANHLKDLQGLPQTIAGAVKADFGFFKTVADVPMALRPDVVAGLDFALTAARVIHVARRQVLTTFPANTVIQSIKLDV